MRKVRLDPGSPKRSEKHCCAPLGSRVSEKVRKGTVLLQRLDKEIIFKVSVGSVVALQHLDKEIAFKLSVGSVVLLQHLEKEIPFQGVRGLCGSVATS